MKQASGIARTEIAPKAGPQVDGLYVSKKTADFGMVKRTIDGDSTVYALPFQSVITQSATGTVTLTPEQNGATVVLDSTDPITVQLPTAQKGLKYNVLVVGVDNAHAVSPTADAGIAAKGLTAALDKDLINSTSAAYDAVELEAVSAVLWIARIVGTWTKQA
jgi:hypothetical protein